jgi:hypothetical protein
LQYQLPLELNYLVVPVFHLILVYPVFLALTQQVLVFQFQLNPESPVMLPLAFLEFPLLLILVSPDYLKYLVY